MERRTPSYAAASLRVFDVALGEMLWSRRSVFLALVVGGPVLVALVMRLVAMVHAGAFRIDGVGVADGVAGPIAFGLMIWYLYLRFIVPILGVFYGTSLIADEVDDKTITYLFVRPIPRGAVLLGKYLAYLACTVLIVLPSVLLVYFLIVPIGGGSIAATFPDLLKDLGMLALGLCVYGALFAFVGAQLRRPLLFGLFFAFGWEVVTLSLPGYLKRFTVAYYLQALVPHAMPQDSAVSFLQAWFSEPLSAWVAVGALLAMLAGFLVLAVRAVERREYVLEQ